MTRPSATTDSTTGGLRVAHPAPSPEALRLLDGDVERAAAGARVAPHLVWAVADVEAPGGGYLPDGRLKILFEAHWFDRLTGGAHRAAHPALSAPRWDRRLYWGGAAEYVRLGRARALDDDAALKATSWGAGQTLGVNHARAGYADVRAMIEAFAADPAAQVAAILAFLRSARALKALREHRFAAVARAYNGPGFATHGYHLRLSAAAAARAGLDWLAPGAAGAQVAELQEHLAAAGFSPGAADGAFGPKSATALLAYQAATGLPHPFW